MDVLNEVELECDRQIAKWGIQNWPSVDNILLNRQGGCTPERMCEHYEIPSESRAKQLLNLSLNNGDLTYAHIALEEFCESICAPNEKLRREELIQTAAVIVSWIKCIDRSNEKN